jgi:hypothetical protein
MLGFLKNLEFMKSPFLISILWGQLSGSTFLDEILLPCSVIGGINKRSRNDLWILSIFDYRTDMFIGEDMTSYNKRGAIKGGLQS